MEAEPRDLAADLGEVMSRTTTPRSTTSSPSNPPSQPTGKLALRDRPTKKVRLNHPRVEVAQLDAALRVRIRQACGEDGRWPFYLWSRATGTGKTTAALLLLDRGAPPNKGSFSPDEACDVMAGFVDYRGFPAFLECVRRKECSWYYDGSGGHLTEARVWTFLGRTPLVVVDDVCDIPNEAVRFGQDHRGLLKKVLDLRCSRPTLVTGNLSPVRPADGSPPEIIRVLDTTTSDRISDRLLCGTVHELRGTSRRWD
jgi:hypothetical protein